MGIRIVTDSAADLPPQVAQALSIAVVPLAVVFGEASYRDGLDLDADRFYSMLVSGEVFPTTSAPAVADFQATYERLLNEVDAIVSIHIPAKLSGTINAANSARAALAEPARIEIVDSQSVSLGTGLVAIAAARVAQAGGTLEEVVGAAGAAALRVHMYFVLDTLEYLRRGGRIGRARAFLGSLLNVKPILSIRDGEIHPEERQRTRDRALDRIYQLLTSYPSVTDVVVVHSTAPNEAEELRRRFAAAFPSADFYLSRLSPVLGAHAGPGAVGAGVLELRP